MASTRLLAFCFLAIVATSSGVSTMPQPEPQHRQRKQQRQEQQQGQQRREAQRPPPQQKTTPAEVPEVLVIGRQREQGMPVVPIGSIGSRDVFGPQRVRETGSRDLNDLVQHLPALSTRPYNGGEAAAPSFSMRGLPDDGLTEYVHVLIDGVPASPLPYGWTAFSFLPVTTGRVHGLDYVRGGHAVRYSPNTIGGVLNFITQPIPREPRLEMSSTLGNFDYASHTLSAGGTWDDVGVLVTYVDRRGDGYRRDGEFDQQDANVKVRLDTSENGWLAASVGYMESEHRAPGGLTQAQFAADRFGNARPHNRFDGHRAVFDVVGHRDFGSDDWIEAFGYLSETRRHLRAQRPHFGSPTEILDWNDESYVGAVGLRLECEGELLGVRHTLYGGARYQREWLPSWKIRSEPFPGGGGTLTQDAEYDSDILSLHLDDTVDLTSRLKAVLGARVEWIPSARGDDPVAGWRFDDDFFRVLPGGGLSYELTETWAVYGNYFEGFRAPQVWGYAFAVSDPNLEFETGHSFEVGTRWEELHGVSGSLVGWRVDYDDFGVFYSGFYENLGRIVARGVDLVLDWDAGDSVEELEGLSLSGAVTLQDSELRSGPNRGNETPYAWKEKATWRARFETEGGWNASVGGVYVGDSFSDDANTRAPNANGNLGLNDSWVLWDAQVARDMRLGEEAQLKLALGITNLFDREWEVHSRGGFFGGGLVAGPPRQFYFSAGLTF